MTAVHFLSNDESTSLSSRTNAPSQTKHHEENHLSLDTILRTIASISIPTALAFIISLFATFVMHANDGASYFYNTWFLFCKLLFPCLPLMMLFIMKK